MAVMRTNTQLLLTIMEVFYLVLGTVAPCAWPWSGNAEGTLFEVCRLCPRHEGVEELPAARLGGGGGMTN